MATSVTESTFILVKPDALIRGLAGEIITRIENRGLTLTAMRVSSGETATIEQHYPTETGWIRNLGASTLDDYAQRGDDPTVVLGSSDPDAIGATIREQLVDYLASHPVIAMVVTGHRAVTAVRGIIGATIPINAVAGTIRGDYSCDSPHAATVGVRPVHNLVHASSSPEEANREIALWFPQHRDD